MKKENNQEALNSVSSQTRRAANEGETGILETQIPEGSVMLDYQPTNESNENIDSSDLVF